MSVLQESGLRIILILVFISTAQAVVSIVKCSPNLNHCSCDGILKCVPFHLTAKTLSISHGEDLRIRPGAFQNMSLKRLSLHKVKVEYIDCEAFLGLEETLESVTLSEVDLPGDEEFPLCTLANLRNLKSINIRNTKIKYFGKKPLATRKLESLILRDVGLQTILFRNLFHSMFTLSAVCLSGNGLRESMYREIGYLQTLEKLNLSNNNFTELPSSELWQNLRNLKSVSFRNNKISHIKTDTFLQNLNSIETTGFETIDLRGNDIMFIQPGAFANVYVETFHLSDNPLQTLGEDVNAFRGLDVKYLYLANASLNSLASGIFDQFKSLTFLDLSRNRLVDAEWISPVTCRSLAYLDLRANHINSFVPNCPADAVIEIVDLRDNELLVVDNTDLRVGTLFLSHNQLVSANLTLGLKTSGMTCLGHNFLTSLSPITMVISRENTFFYGVIDVSANSMKQLPAIQFRLGGDTEGDDQSSTKILRITLRVISTENIIHTLTPFQIDLSEVAFELTSVKVNLRHQRNNVSTFPSCEFFDNQSHVVHDLDLSYNVMKDVNLENCQLKGLEALNLDYNEITTIVLRKAKDLRILTLRGNRISRVDKSFLKALHYLHILDLRDNQLKSFPDIANSLPRLVRLKLQNNPLKCDCGMAWTVNIEYRLGRFTCDSTTRFRGYDMRFFLRHNCTPRVMLPGNRQRPHTVHDDEDDDKPNRRTLSPQMVLPDHYHETIALAKDAATPGVSRPEHDGRYTIPMKDIVMIVLASLLPVTFMVLIAVTVLYCRVKGRENKKLEQERKVEMNKLFAMRRPSGIDGIIELRRPSDVGGFGLRRPSVGFELPFPTESTIVEKRSPVSDPPFIEISLAPEEKYDLYPAITKPPNKSGL